MRLSHSSALALCFQISLAHPTSSSLLRRQPALDTLESPRVLDLQHVQLSTANRILSRDARALADICKASVKAGEKKKAAQGKKAAQEKKKEEKKKAAEKKKGEEVKEEVEQGEEVQEELEQGEEVQEEVEQGEEEVGNGEEEVAEGDEVVIEGTFDTPVALQGDDLKQDTTFTASVGKFEVEFQAQTARTLTVSENKQPAAPPAGFTAVEPSSFIVKFEEGGDALTLGQIDFLFDIANAALEGIDLSTTQIGKLCTETNTFIIDPALGEIEFEVEENEIVLKVENLDGEFGIFAPIASGAGAENNNNAEAGEGAGEGAAEEEEEGKAGQLEAAGFFGTPNNVDANVFTNLNFAPNAAGALEVEHNGTTANQITVAPKMAATAPPAGHLFVDPLTFVISTANLPAEGDQLKVDYKFTPEIKAAIDPAQVIPGKFDAATQQFITTDIGEFEFEVEEDEWSLTVTDLNGEWAWFVPETAVL